MIPAQSALTSYEIQRRSDLCAATLCCDAVGRAVNGIPMIVCRVWQSIQIMPSDTGISRSSVLCGVGPLLYVGFMVSRMSDLQREYGLYAEALHALAVCMQQANRIVSGNQPSMNWQTSLDTMKRAGG